MFKYCGLNLLTYTETWDILDHKILSTNQIQLIQLLSKIKLRKVLLMAQLIEKWKQRAKQIKIEIFAMYLAYKDPRVPWYARIFAACVVGYAFSPIDLIPDPIPILGYFDDLILIPLGVVIALRMIPDEVMAECREQSQEIMRKGKPVNWIAAIVIIAIWILFAAIVIDFIE